MELITRSARLAPYSKRPKQAAGFVTAYAYEPPPDDEASTLGNLFAVIEVVASGRMAEEVAELVLDTLSQTYYEADHSDQSSQPMARFEAAIKTVNRELGDYVERGNAAWVGKLSAIAAVQVGSELHLAQTGSAEAFLSRGQHQAHISGGTETRGPQFNKAFGSITSGHLEVGDRLLLATPALVHQLALTKLHDLVTGNSPAGAINAMTELLEGAQSERVAVVVVEVTTPELAAMQVRSDEPDDVVLAANPTPLATAKQAATPLAQATLRHYRRLQPHAKRLGWQAAGRIRRGLAAGPNRSWGVAAVAGVLLLVLAVVLWPHHHAAPVKPKAAAVTQQTSGPDLTKVTPSTVVSLTGSPSRLEQSGQKLVAVGSTGITLVDPAKGSTQHLAGSLGSVAATTATTDGDVFILTHQPAIWRYNHTDNSLSRQTVQGGLPVGTVGLGSYNGNLYFLGSDGSITKSISTTDGFGPAGSALPTGLSGAKAITVDGSIYALNSSTLVRYLSGVLQQTLELPVGLTGATTLRSVASGATLVATDSTDGHVGLFEYGNRTTLMFERQFELNGSSRLTDAVFDTAGNTIYGLAGTKLVKFNP